MLAIGIGISMLFVICAWILLVSFVDRRELLCIIILFYNNWLYSTIFNKDEWYHSCSFVVFVSIIVVIQLNTLWWFIGWTVGVTILCISLFFCNNQLLYYVQWRYPFVFIVLYSFSMMIIVLFIYICWSIIRRWWWTSVCLHTTNVQLRSLWDVRYSSKLDEIHLFLR